MFEVNEDGTLTYIDFEDTSYAPVDMLVYNEEGNEWIVVACQKGGIVESYRFGKEKGGQVYETEYSCMVNEPVCLNTNLLIISKANLFAFFLWLNIDKK